MASPEGGLGASTSVPSGNAELAASTWGGEGTPVVAVHPGVGDRRTWRWCAPVWARAGYCVVAYDRRGFGETRYSEELHDDLTDLRAVTRATASRPAVIVGNSLGGGLALDLALTYPDEVIALVLVAPSPSGYPYEAWQATEAETELDGQVEAAEASGDLDLVNRLEVRCWLDGTEQPEGRVTGAPRDLMIDMNRRALQSGPVGETRPRRAAWPRLEEATAPTLVVAGGYDLPGIGRVCSELAECLPDARLVTIDESAHCPSLDQPAQLNELVLAFLESLKA